jgi:hypothetical protein
MDEWKQLPYFALINVLNAGNEQKQSSVLKMVYRVLVNCSGGTSIKIQSPYIALMALQ